MNSSQISRIVEAVINNVDNELQKTAGTDAALEDMTLNTAKQLSERVEQKAKDMGLAAVVAITNRGGNPVLVQCMDDAFLASYDIALGKAYTTVALKMSTIELKKLAQPGGSLYGIQNTNQGKIIIFGGGIPLQVNGRIIGGLGVSGGTEEQDTALAEYGKDVFLKIMEENNGRK